MVGFCFALLPVRRVTRGQAPLHRETSRTRNRLLLLRASPLRVACWLAPRHLLRRLARQTSRRVRRLEDLQQAWSVTAARPALLRPYCWQRMACSSANLSRGARILWKCLHSHSSRKNVSAFPWRSLPRPPRRPWRALPSGRRRPRWWLGRWAAAPGHPSGHDGAGGSGGELRRRRRRRAGARAAGGAAADPGHVGGGVGEG